MTAADGEPIIERMRSPSLIRKLLVFLLLKEVQGFVLSFARRPARTTLLAQQGEMQDLYRTVAEQNPEWFENFVVDILGEEAVGADLVAMAKEQKAVQSTQRQSPAFNNTTTLDANNTDLEEEVQKNLELNKPDLEKEVKTEKEAPLSFVDTVSHSNVSVDIEHAGPQQYSQGIAADASKVNVTNLDEQNSVGLPDKATFAGEHGITSTPENRTSAARTTTDFAVVAYKDSDSQSWRQVPLIDLVNLGYTEGDIRSLEPDALHLIVNEGIRKPSSGLPSRWKAKDSESKHAQIYLSGAEALKAMGQKSSSESKLVPPVSSSRPRFPPEPKEPLLKEEDPIDEFRAREERDREPSHKSVHRTLSSRDEELVKTPERTTTRAREKTSGGAKIAKAAGTTQEAIDQTNDEAVNIKANQIGDSLKTMKRESGGDEKIIQDQKHETVPPSERRRRNAAEGDITPGEKVETGPSLQRQSDDGIVSNGEKETTRASQRRRDRATNKSVETGSSQQSRRERMSRLSQSQRKSAGSTRAPRAREARSMSEERRERPMYSGRRSPAKKEKDDPPPSSSGLWPDMETFRSLLRNEAGLRLRILGDDWKDVVRDESKWRHDLYKEWLWTLHNGLGSPLVETRSDRLRRQRSEQGSFSERPMRPRFRKGTRR